MTLDSLNNTLGSTKELKSKGLVKDLGTFSSTTGKKAGKLQVYSLCEYNYKFFMSNLYKPETTIETIERLAEERSVWKQLVKDIMMINH